MQWLAWLTGRFHQLHQTSNNLHISPQTQESLCKALRTDSLSSVQDLVNCLLLSECVYKAHDLGPKEAVKALQNLQETFPQGVTTLQAVQCSLPHVHHRYLVATSPNTVYVSFIGTKLAKDILVDANFMHRPLWQASDTDRESPAAHRGFLARARRVPVEQLLEHAQKTDRKLLLCGHSLGGAVAILCTLRVLQQASDAGLPKPLVRCITFGTPAIGNPALASRVVEKGWKDCFQNVILPEDLVPRLLALNPDASAEELSVEPEALGTGAVQLPPQRRWTNPGFASRLTAFRRPQVAVSARGPDAAATQMASGQPGIQRPLGPPGDIGEPGDEPHALEGSGHGAATAGGTSRVWVLPQRLWNRGNGSSFSQDSNTLPPLSLEASAAAGTTHNDEPPVDPATQSGGPLRQTRMGGALQAVGRRMPLQGWWGANGLSADEGMRQGERSLSSNEEDGAVDALVAGPPPEAGPGPAAERSAAQRMTWLRRLGQLQSLAVSAASSVGGVGQLLPTFVHFGRTLAWTAVETLPDLPAPFPTSDVRSRLLANHRMPAYRLRALAHCRATPDMPAPHPGSSSAYLSEEVLPRVVLHRAAADLQPLAPSDPAAGSQNRWSWIPYVGGEGGGQTPELTVQLQVEGEHLSGLRQGRLLAYGSTWCPVRIMDVHRPVKDSLANAAAANASNAEEGVTHAGPHVGPGALGWLQKRLTREPEDAALAAEARLPSAIALQVYHGQPGSLQPALELHLRSDFAQVTVPVSVRMPTVWISGTSAAATRHLMLALGAQSPTARAATPALPVQPAELVLDGAKWCNLLAAPVITPSLALSALSTALPASPVHGPARTGPLWLANSMLQGLQGWLVGPQLNLRDGASCSAIVLAIDDAAPLPARQLSKLRLQAERAGVRLLVIQLGEDAAGVAARNLQLSMVTTLSQEGGALKPESVLALRQEVFRALSGQPAVQHVSKL